MPQHPVLLTHSTQIGIEGTSARSRRTAGYGVQRRIRHSTRWGGSGALNGREEVLDLVGGEDGGSSAGPSLLVVGERLSSAAGNGRATDPAPRNAAWRLTEYNACRSTSRHRLYKSAIAGSSGKTLRECRIIADVMMARCLGISRKCRSCGINSFCRSDMVRFLSWRALTARLRTCVSDCGWGESSGPGVDTTRM